MENYKQESLVIMEGPDQGAAYPLEGPTVTLGRATDNTIVLDSGKISRHHAQIRRSPTGATIEDLGSTNGTWVNNQRLFEPHALEPGDMIRLADHITFRFVATPQAMGTDRMMSDVPQRTQMVGQEFDYGQPRTRAYGGSDYVEPYVPPTPPSYTPPPPTGRQAAPQAQPEPVRVREETGGKPRPKWLYVLIGVLVLLLCLCVATAVYLWFAPREFWEGLFELFNIPFPTICLCLLRLI